MKDKKDNRTTYNSLYYETNIEVISKNKKKRYREDPLYRESIKIRAAERKRALLEERRLLRKMGLIKIQRKIKKYQVHVGDRVYIVPMLTIGRLALSLNRKIVTIRLWERRGVIPRATYRNSNGERLYTVFQVKHINKIYRDEVRKYGIGVLEHRISTSDFIQKVRDLWDEYPLGFDLNGVKNE